jgi:hypothetical protein
VKILFPIVLLFTAGCSNLPGDLRKGIPNGTWESVNVTVTGKFSATKIVGTGVFKDGDTITARELRINHSNVWIPMIEVNAIGYAPKTTGTPNGPVGQSIY